MAEAIFKEKVKQKGLESIYKADSAGTASYHIGETPDPRTLSTLEDHGISFSHRGQQFDEDLNQQFDYLVAMDSSNKQNMERLIGRADKLFLMRDFDPEGRGLDVCDEVSIKIKVGKLIKGAKRPHVYYLIVTKI